MSTLQSKDCQMNDPNDLFPTSIKSFHDPLNNLPLPFTGFFNGYNVELRTPQDMELHKMGWFGKGSGSRSQPLANRKCPIMRKRQFKKRNDWLSKFSGKEVTSKPDLFLQAVDKLTAEIIKEGEKTKRKSTNFVDLVSSDGSCDDEDEEMEATMVTSKITDTDNIAVVVPDSDSELEDTSYNYFANFKAECGINQTKLQEKHMLTLQEAFFLVYGFGCLQIINTDNCILDIEQTWKLFNETDKKFTPKYVVYHYFRSKGYIVKPGIKFGGDFCKL